MKKKKPIIWDNELMKSFFRPITEKKQGKQKKPFSIVRTIIDGGSDFEEVPIFLRKRKIKDEDLLPIIAECVKAEKLISDNAEKKEYLFIDKDGRIRINRIGEYLLTTWIGEKHEDVRRLNDRITYLLPYIKGLKQMGNEFYKVDIS